VFYKRQKINNLSAGTLRYTNGRTAGKAIGFTYCAQRKTEATVQSKGHWSLQYRRTQKNQRHIHRHRGHGAGMEEASAETQSYIKMLWRESWGMEWKG